MPHHNRTLSSNNANHANDPKSSSLRDALRCLSKRQRELLEMQLITGFTPAEIEVFFNLGKSEMQERLAKARKKILTLIDSNRGNNWPILLPDEPTLH